MDPDPLEDENVAETLCTKDDEKSGDINKLVGEPTEPIGGHKQNLHLNLKNLVGSNTFSHRF